MPFQQEQTEAYHPEDQRELVYANYKRIDQTNQSIAKAILARDYKGFGGGLYTQNGVIECEKKNQ